MNALAALSRNSAERLSLQAEAVTCALSGLSCAAWSNPIARHIVRLHKFHIDFHHVSFLYITSHSHIKHTEKLDILRHQVAYSLLDRRPQNGMAEFCQQHGISILPYGVIAGGLLSDRYLGADASECAAAGGIACTVGTGCVKAVAGLNAAAFTAPQRRFVVMKGESL